eukprot:TRINITY_DN2072_c0_g1_i4.p1 TRINITY_DN2072_c0_g1~~TRINITY_DN2072_c0_g1_i4.p1  ORF type:complete len:267 (-),score=57.76 TRINITY_DN2072_c0_g1_i4:97-897(-)
MITTRLFRAKRFNIRVAEACGVLSPHIPIAYNPQHHISEEVSPPCGLANPPPLPSPLSTKSHHIRIQRRFAHTDIPTPDFSYYRRKSSLKRTLEDKEDREISRKAFTYLIVAAGGVVAVTMGKAIVNTLLGTMSMAASEKAMAQAEVDLSGIPEGKGLIVKWRGKPLFIRHRTDEEVEDMLSTPMDDLRDPQHDSERATEPKWLVLIGVCTHLGCVPISHAGEYNGYFCPCHGSHYDASGRIRKGPAPLNLEIPPYEIDGDNLIVG